MKHRSCLLPSVLSLAYSVSFLRQPMPSRSRGVRAYCGLGPSSSIINEESSPKDLPAGRLMKKFSHLRWLFLDHQNNMSVLVCAYMWRPEVDMSMNPLQIFSLHFLVKWKKVTIIMELHHSGRIVIIKFLWITMNKVDRHRSFWVKWNKIFCVL